MSFNVSVGKSRDDDIDEFRFLRGSNVRHIDKDTTLGVVAPETGFVADLGLLATLNLTGGHRCGASVQVTRKVVQYHQQYNMFLEQGRDSPIFKNDS
jgi:hypothetical protein